MNLVNRIATALYRRRMDCGWSQTELAATAKVSPTTIREIESGRRNMRIGTLEVLAVALGMTSAELLRRALALENEPIKMEKIT